MRVQINLNDHFAQRLLNDNEFRNRLTLVYDENRNISQVWIENEVENNDELTFRSQALDFIRIQFGRIYEEQLETLSVANALDNEKPTYVLRPNANPKLRVVVSIISFRLD